MDVIAVWNVEEYFVKYKTRFLFFSLRVSRGILTGGLVMKLNYLS